MAERTGSRASVRLRTTLAATLVVAVALLVGAVALVAMVRGSLHAGVETTAEQRAEALVAQVETSGLASLAATDDDDSVLDDEGDRGEQRDADDEPEEVVWQVLDEEGAVVRASQALARALPTDEDETALPGADHRYLLAGERARSQGRDYEVVVGVSLEEVADSTSALVPPLALGLPVILLLVAGTTWTVASRALAPVERIRREVDHITGDRLDRRVPEPAARDEIHRLAQTMNRMLARLQDSRTRQQQFVADASHELRSPLASIRQTAEVAQAHPGALAEGELAEAVLEESIRMQRLVEQLLLLTRDGEDRAAPRHDVDLDDLALAEARRVTSVGVDTSGIGPGRVRGDTVALGQVMRNLVDNAVRHADSAVAVGVRESGDGVELVVEDDGHGIDPADRGRVFERFVRLDEARARDTGGSGLGLAIVRSIVTAHGGTVTVQESALGGARVVVRLPRPA